MQIIRFFRVKPERFIVYDNQIVYNNPVQMCGNFMRDQFFHFAKGTHVNFFFLYFNTFRSILLDFEGRL